MQYLDFRLQVRLDCQASWDNKAKLFGFYKAAFINLAKKLLIS